MQQVVFAGWAYFRCLGMPNTINNEVEPVWLSFLYQCCFFVVAGSYCRYSLLGIALPTGLHNETSPFTAIIIVVKRTMYDWPKVPLSSWCHVAYFSYHNIHVVTFTIIGWLRKSTNPGNGLSFQSRCCMSHGQNHSWHLICYTALDWRRVK